MRRILLSLALISLSTVAMVGTPSRAAALPSGFVDQKVASVSQPTSVESLPGGRIVVLEKASGRVRIFDGRSGVLTSQVALDLDVCSNSERGLLGFAADPEVEVSGRVYVFYTRPAASAPGGCVNRVSAFRLTGDRIDPSSEQVLLDNISSIGGNHNAGDLEVGHDGWLYVATGDAGRDPRGDSGGGGSNDAAADLSLLNGKILRVDPLTGRPAPGNPFSGSGTAVCGLRGNTASTPGSSCQEVFAFGLRNPFRFAFDPNTSATRFFINDVGQNTQEEVNEARAGADYGWNRREGNCPQGETAPCAGPSSGVTDPITQYDHGRGGFITAGAFVPDGVWPAEYDGGYLFADGGSGRVWLRRADGSVDYDAPFTDGLFGIADMAFVTEPGGTSLYYTLTGRGEVRKLTWQPPSIPSAGPARYVPNTAPVRAFDSRDQSPPARLVGGGTRLIELDAPAGATSALVNLTMVAPAGGAFLTAWQPRTVRPATSNLNAAAGQVVANTSVVPLDDQGRFVLFVRTTTAVVVDVSGFFVAAGAAPVASGRFESLDPVRLIDTREPIAPANEFTQVFDVGDPTPDGPSRVTRLNVPIGGRAGVPTSGVGSVAMIVTGLDDAAAGPGFVRVAPSASNSETSNINTTGSGDVRANLVVVALGSDGAVDVDLRNTSDVLIDVVGWFSDATEPAMPVPSGLFQLIEPSREIDTRLGAPFGSLGERDTVVLDPVSVPKSAAAVAQNIVMAPSTAASFVTAYPGGPLPRVSNLNSSAGGQFPGSAAITALNDGSESIFTLRPTELVVDVFGYFN